MNDNCESSFTDCKPMSVDDIRKLIQEKEALKNYLMVCREALEKIDEISGLLFEVDEYGVTFSAISDIAQEALKKIGCE